MKRIFGVLTTHFRALAILIALQAGPVAAAPAEAPDPTTTDFSASNLQLELPLFDARVNGSVGAWPGMQQSLMITKGTYYLVHAGVLEIIEPSGQRRSPVRKATLKQIGLLLLADVVLTSLPPGDAWMHEEWHRAVMSRRDIDSYNGVYDFEIFAEAIPVRKVRDEDLVRLKRDHPAEMVRLSSAGFEAQLSLNLEFDKDRFYRGTQAGAVVTQWWETVNLVGYMLTAAYDSDDVTEEVSREEGVDVADRDFTGLDPVGWVYDLHRPDEPYEARGVHPSGVGVDRYRSESDLTPEELSYLRTQAWLSLLNFADPTLFGLYGLHLGPRGGRHVRFNASAQHLLAPFGYSIRLNLFLSAGHVDWFSQLHCHVSDSLVLPELTLDLVRYPLPVLGASVSPGARLWIQPEEQRFFVKSGAWGGAARLRLNIPLRPWVEVYLEGSVKTDGWIAGDVFLGESSNASIGMEALMF